jgi:hypothetical protein
MKKSNYVGAISAGFLVAGWGMNLFANPNMPSDEVLLRAVPKVAKVVETKRQEACDAFFRVDNHKRKMEENYGQKGEGNILDRHANLKSMCDRRTSILNTLMRGSDDEKLDIVKKIYADPDVQAAIDAIVKKAENKPHVNDLRHGDIIF